MDKIEEHAVEVAVYTTADAGTALTESLSSGIVTMDPHEVHVLVEWPDGSNDPDSRVQVSLSYPHRRIVPLVWLADTLELEAVSTLRIAH